MVYRLKAPIVTPLHVCDILSLVMNENDELTLLVLTLRFLGQVQAPALESSLLGDLTRGLTLATPEEWEEADRDWSNATLPSQVSDSLRA